jgi:hypothetical protein
LELEHFKNWALKSLLKLKRKLSKTFNFLNNVDN